MVVVVVNFILLISLLHSSSAPEGKSLKIANEPILTPKPVEAALGMPMHRNKHVSSIIRIDRMLRVCAFVIKIVVVALLTYFHRPMENRNADQKKNVRNNKALSVHMHKTATEKAVRTVKLDYIYSGRCKTTQRGQSQ